MSTTNKNSEISEQIIKVTKNKKGNNAADKKLVVDEPDDYVSDEDVVDEAEAEATPAKKGRKAKAKVAVDDTHEDGGDEPKKGRKAKVAVVDTNEDGGDEPKKGKKAKKANAMNEEDGGTTKVKRGKKFDTEPTKSKKEIDQSSEDEEEDDHAKRHVKTPVERIDLILQRLNENGVTKEVHSQLQRLRKQLDGAKIKQVHQSRAPNEYNLWMKVKMSELKDSDMTPKQRFAHCIKQWNAEKDSKAAAA